MTLILPKQTATEEVITIVLKIYYDQDAMGNPIVKNSLLKSELTKAGIAATDKAGQVKQSEMLRYFGLVYYDYKKRAGQITSSGKAYYNALLSGDKNTQMDIIARSIVNDIFGIGAKGGYNTAVEKSDSALEVPKLFVKAICGQKGITLNEFSFLICDIQQNKHSFDDACSKMCDLEDDEIDLETTVHGYGKFGDPKIHAFLKNIGFCYKDPNGKYQLDAYVEGKYASSFESLDIFNRKAALKSYTNPKRKLLSAGNGKIKESDVDCGTDYKDEVLSEAGYDLGSAELNRQNNRTPETANTKKGRKYKVNPKLGKTQQKLVGYICEIDASHVTFDTQGKKEKTPHPFMESHHLLPMKAQDDYGSVNIDRTSNLICLCPNCHSQIHYGTEAERRLAVYALYAKRFAAFSAETAISLTDAELFDRYYK